MEPEDLQTLGEIHDLIREEVAAAHLPPAEERIALEKGTSFLEGIAAGYRCAAKLIRLIAEGLPEELPDRHHVADLLETIGVQLEATAAGAATLTNLN